MGNFIKALARTLKWEGGYDNDPDDRGGETYRGISRVNFPKWKGWARISELRRRGDDLDSDPDLQIAVKEFYAQEFWLKIQGDVLPDLMAAEAFDIAVNCGVGTAVRFMQRAVGAQDDGAMGPATLRAITTAVAEKGEGPLVEALKEQRRERYRKIAASNPTQEKYLKGWIRRADDPVA